MELIGYVDIFVTQAGAKTYNFWAKLQRERGGSWLPFDDGGTAGKHYKLSGGDLDGLELKNNQVLWISLDGARQDERDPSWVRLRFTNRQLQDHIRLASEAAGLYPVVHGLSIDGAGLPADAPGGSFALREHLTDQDMVEGRDRRPYLRLRDGDRNSPPRQKGAAYVPENGPVLLDGSEGAREWFYGLCQVEYPNHGNHYLARARIPEEGARKYMPDEDARLWEVFEDGSQDGIDFTFPKYIFLSDLIEADEEEPEALPADEAGRNDESAWTGGLEEAGTAEVGEMAGDGAEGLEAGRARSPGELAEELYRRVRRCRNYTRSEILSIAINLTQNFLTVFSGEPGCGKTSICNIFGQVLGLRREDQKRYVMVPVERGWTSKRDFIGYFNPLAGAENAIVKANAQLDDAILRAAEEGEDPEAMLLVVLDEANLSPMEYYWSDFMGIAGGDDGEVDRHISLGGAEGERYISPACRFAATINNDHTTTELSPRIIDRAAVVVLPTPRSILEEDAEEDGGGRFSIHDSDRYTLITWRELNGAFGAEEPPAAICRRMRQESEEAWAVYQSLVNRLSALRVEVSRRAHKAILRFWSAARQEGVFEGESQLDRDIAALDYAVAQRLLPKLSGSGAQFRQGLEDLAEYCRQPGEGVPELAKCAGILSGIIQRGGEDDSTLNYYSFFREVPV